ncbi:hypothetical protein ACN47E_007960 [Coniothyrium glycines]
MADEALLLASSPAGRVPKPQPQGTEGSTTGGPSAAGPSPNPRSCVTCRRRKVKCNKNVPCSHCVRAKVECIFPGPGRAPRKSRKLPDAELLERLRRLEGVVSSLNAQVEGHEHDAEHRERERERGQEQHRERARQRQSSAGEDRRPYGHTEAQVAADSSVHGLESRFGRLVIEKGRSRYINNSFWASLNNEVEDLKAILIEPDDDDDDDDAQSPGTSSSSQHQSFIFGFSSANIDMQALHPPEHQARHFWEAFKENVDPLVKVLHIPTFEPVLLDALAHMDKVGRGLEAFLFCIYYGAVTSTTADECLRQWGEDRTTLLNRYRVGVEQGLARANFLYCDEVVVLQAFVVFLMLLRRNDDARKIWTLTGLVVRIAQTLGVHRDGSHFGLPAFEIEMRRRLWWQICFLDARSSEDHGCDPTIVEAFFDTKMPLNVNDDDIQPGMPDFPEERQGFTDMTFCLLRFEVSSIFRRILYIPPNPYRCTEYFEGLSIAEKEKWITECHQKMENKYFKDCDMSIPLCWVTATISRLIMSKMWLIVYHPHQRKDGGATLPQDIKDKLFITSLENIEYSILLETEARTMKWGWLFRTYVQWHAIAFLLSELCVRTKGEAVERAWRALEASAGRWWFPLSDTSSNRKGQQGCLWKPLRKLLAKAKAVRSREIALERASMALRDGQYAFNYVGQVQLPPVSVDNPGSGDLDRMLRPSAPKLGEMPIAQQPTWPSIPVPINIDGASSTSSSDVLAKEQQQVIDKASGARAGGYDPGQNLYDLTTFGLDQVVMDVMNDSPVDGVSVNHYPEFKSTSKSNSIPNSATFPTLSSTTGPSSTLFPDGRPRVGSGYPQPTYGDAMFSNPAMDFITNSPILDSNGQPTDSPPMDGGQMDWTLWDDMVNQYGGVDGQAANQATSVGLGHIGMVDWF